MKQSLPAIFIFGLVSGLASLVAAQHQSETHGGGMMGGVRGQGSPDGHTIVGQRSSSQTAREVAAIYSSLCAGCHGATGRGDGPAAMDRNPKPKDFSDCKAMARHSDSVLLKIIKDGGQSVGHSPLMPAWGGSLSDAQMHGLVVHIRSFCKE